MKPLGSCVASISGASLIAVGWLLLLPDQLFAWGPGTHVALGEIVLSSLYLLPPALRELLRRHPVPFLYGSIAADISFAKKYVPEGRHCHDWRMGDEILRVAGDDALRAVALGYLAHLAADTVAHNFFVPRRLLLTSTTQAMGHTYWEHRMDVHVGDQHLLAARRIVMEHDHSEADALFDEVLSSTIFNFRTNRRIFRGMIRFQGHERWMQVFDKVLQKSRFDLPEATVETYLSHAFDSVADVLVNAHQARAYHLDPTGKVSLALAKKIRRRAMADGAAEEPGLLREMAEDFFPLPAAELGYWTEVQSSQSFSRPA